MLILTNDSSNKREVFLGMPNNEFSRLMNAILIKASFINAWKLHFCLVVEEQQKREIGSNFTMKTGIQGGAVLLLVTSALVIAGRNLEAEAHLQG